MSNRCSSKIGVVREHTAFFASAPATSFRIFVLRLNGVAANCRAGRSAEHISFQRTFENLRKKDLKDSQFLRDAIDFSKLRIAWKLYLSQFKDVVPMRHAVGHEAEFYSSLESRAMHSGQNDLFVEFVMTDTILSMSSYGKMVSIDVSQRTVDKLEKIKQLVVEAYAGVMVAV
jgi:hypothetical protein